MGRCAEVLSICGVVMFDAPVAAAAVSSRNGSTRAA